MEMPPMPPSPITMGDHALGGGRVLVVGGGIAGMFTLFQLQEAAESSGNKLELHWAFDNQTDTSSTGAGAYFAVFASTDKRCGEWAERSWTLGKQIFDRLGVGDLVSSTPTLYISNIWPLQLPPGLPSKPVEVAPADFGLGSSYKYGAWVEQGRVFSPRELIPAMTDSLENLPGVFTYKNTHFRDIEDIRRFAEELGITTVFVCAGAGVGRLLGHVEPEVQGSLGVLIHLEMRDNFGFHNTTVVMDEDDDGELAYTIPAPASRTIGIGGTVQNLYEFPYSPGASDVPDHRAQRALICEQAEEEFELIRLRAMEKFPSLRQALRRATKNNMTYALRPYAAGVILRVLPPSVAGDLAIAEISGLGGSGFTIAPAVTQDALKLVIPEWSKEVNV